MTTIDKRNEAIVAMAKTGLTYEEIGRTIGLTRERVRQILKLAGITGSTTRGARNAAKATALEADRHLILEWAKGNPGLGVRDAERALGLKQGRVAEALGAEAGRVFVRQRRNPALRYTDADLVRALRAAAAVKGDPMTIVAYEQYVARNGGPSGVLVVKRFGTWKKACQAAGLGTNAFPGNLNRRWGQGQLVEILLDYFNSTTARGTFDDYCRWAGQNADRPSGATVRDRFGSWTAAKRAALAAGALAVAA